MALGCEFQGMSPDEFGKKLREIVEVLWGQPRATDALSHRLLYFATLGGNTFSVTVRPGDTHEDLRKAVGDKTGKRPDMIQIFDGDDELEDDLFSTLYDDAKEYEGKVLQVVVNAKRIPERVKVTQEEDDARLAQRLHRKWNNPRPFGNCSVISQQRPQPYVPHGSM
eukprot:TRINITY_DN61090_c0_g1_i1.p1 TRINITY_DN61090_c0_g1~~TRINITY_DN61090_c0_g1_i1.p1  ORF type:complete len:176 (-),score=20.62 TRINITY_DN61090_c0_g1_i1:65-565(-)